MAKAIYTGVNGVARKVKIPYIGVPNFEKVTLPSGYTQVEYIESSNGQYIDTGVKPNQNTRVVLTMEQPTSATQWYAFGCRNGWLSAMYFFACGSSGTTITPYYGNVYTEMSVNIRRKLTVEMYQGKVYVDGVLTTTLTVSENFQASYNAYLFAINNAGTVWYGSVRIYGCQIYDNGTLTRNFIPCTNSSGTAGLYDLANGKFYANAGSGTFTVGSTHGSKARKVKAGYIGVNGVARQFYSAGIPISNYAVGDTVRINVNGVATDFFVIHRGNPSTSLYDISCNGVWLMMKDVYTKRYWHSTKTNVYASSDIRTYLEGTFFGLLDKDIQSLIKNVKIPYMAGNNSSTVYSGTSGLASKVFLLSNKEVGFTTSDSSYIKNDGACLEYFVGATETNGKLAANYNGVECTWWLRSPHSGRSDTACDVVNADGYCHFGHSDTTLTHIGVRPAFILPLDAVIPEV